MWLPLALLVLAATVSANSSDHGWKPGHEYTYVVRSRTLTSLHKLSDQHVGVLMKGMLILQAKDSNTLIGKVSDGQYARIQKSLPDGWDMEISDQTVEFQPVPSTGTMFEIRLKHGVIRDLVVDRDIPTWKLNILKSIVSQFQVDTQGVNVIKDKDIQVPSDEEPFASFKTMEDSVGGKCEVQYDISPLDDYTVHMHPCLVPLPELKGNGQNINIFKTKNFDNCAQRVNYHFGLTGQSKWEPGSNRNGRFLGRSSTSRIVISGNLHDFVIQSAVTTSKILISTRFWDHQNGMVASKMNVTLREMKKISTPLSPPANPESTGNLVYTYVDPFSQIPGHRIPKRIQSSNEILTSDSVSSVSSSEEAKKGLNLRDFDSSGSSSSSSISSSEENDFWQTKPKMDEALMNPLVPDFVGFEGKARNEEQEIAQAKEFIFEIAKEIENPSDVPEHDTLEKFTKLTNFIRTLNKNWLTKLVESLNLNRDDCKSKDKSKAATQAAWAVIRDSVTQAGTGPALSAIKDWIENDWMNHIEAADVLSRIPHTARLPTGDYLRAFFELATCDKMKKYPLTKLEALVALGDLIHKSQVNKKTVHNRYPVHIFGRPVSKQDRSVEEVFIPYMAKELKAAVEKGESEMIQALIVALGNTGHPMILSVLEPYLEGKQKMTNFQRTLAVGMLATLAETSPKLARSVLYKIYLNTMESHEVRSTAVFLLMSTNPPLSMLQRMAEFTNIDTNKHVNSAVKSCIESLAKLETPEWEELAKKARTVSNLLTNDVYSYQFSHGFYSGSVEDDGSMLTNMILHYIGSNDNIIPSVMYFALFNTYGDFTPPPTELLAMVSSVRNFIESAMHGVFAKDKDAIKTAVEKIVQELNIVAEKDDPVEANLMWRTKYMNLFVPFGPLMIRDLGHTIMRVISNMENEEYINMNRLTCFDVTLGFPTETGLPFVYTLRVPHLNKISGIYESHFSHKTMKMNVKSSMRLACSRKIQGKIAFVTPFDRQHYVAGIDNNIQAYLPVKFNLDADLSKCSWELTNWLMDDRVTRMIHHSVKPYIYINEADSLKPMENKKYWIKSDDAKTITYPENEQWFMKLEFSGDMSKLESLGMGALMESTSSPSTADEEKYCSLDVYLDPNAVKDSPMKLTMAYDSEEVEPKDVKEWTPASQAVEPSSKEPNSEARRKQFLEKVAEGIKLPKSHVIDMTMQVLGDAKETVTLTIALAGSNAENKGRSLMYLNAEIPQFKYEICSASQIHLTPETPLLYDKAIKCDQKGEFDIDMRFGETCSTGEQIIVKGKAEQSEKLKERIKSTPVVKMCEEQMKQGNKILRVCQQAADMATTLDKIDISMDIQSEGVRECLNHMLSVAGNSKYMDVSVDTSKPKNAGKNMTNIKINLSEDMETADIDINAPSMDVEVDRAKISILGLTSNDILGTSDKDLDVKNMIYEEDEPSCMLDKTRAQTFDGKEYPLRLGKCWHVVMTTFPRASSYKPDEMSNIPEDKKVSILAREIEDGKKEVKILFGDIEVLLVPAAPIPQIKVMGEVVPLTAHNTYQNKQGDEVIFEIFKLAEDAIGLVSDKYDVNVNFDGQRAMIQTSECYLDSVRGLCGNFDGDADNDFLGPKNCILRKPELFTASYALTKDQCEGDALTNAKSIQDNDCIPLTQRRPSNVINDVESGRKKENDRGNWGYDHKTMAEKRCTTHRTKVEETGDKLCFSTHRVLSCAPGCNPTETKAKSYEFHCLEKNEGAWNLKKRIEKGAHPDLSQKSVSMSKDINVPIACKA